MFREATVCIMNKIDLLPHLDFSLEEAKGNARQINPQLKFLEMSCKTGEGLDEWTEWLQKQYEGVGNPGREVSRPAHADRRSLHA